MIHTKVKTALMISVAAILMISLASGRSQGQWDLPGTLPPEQFGNILIKRTSEQAGVKPATFSHWSHRQKFTCRVCHFELEFNMEVNTTQITEAMNAAGKFCGAGGCHDGKAAFGHDELHCKNCHNDDLGYGGEKFPLIKKKLPKTKFGNGIDWTKALHDGKITPATYLTLKPPPDVAVIKPLLLAAEWAMIPPAIFSHKKHVRWLDCNNCHPDIFNIKKKTTKHFSMMRILKREFCGVCHLTVAFPMNDCKQCHPNRPDLKE